MPLVVISFATMALPAATSEVRGVLPPTAALKLNVLLPALAFKLNAPFTVPPKVIGAPVNVVFALKVTASL